MLAKELHHLASICSSNLSFACAVPVARNSAVTSEDTLSIRINVLSAVFVEVGVHLSVLLRCRAENRFYDLVCFCRGHPSPIRRPPLTHQVRGLWSAPRYPSRFIEAVPTYRLDWIVVSYSRVAIGTLIDRCDGRHLRPPTPYPC